MAPNIASASKVPPLVSQAPGSSQIAQGVFTRPIAVLPLEPITLSRVLVDLWVIPMRVLESRKRYSPVGSSTDRANRNTILACSMEAAHRTDSVPGRNSSSAGSMTRVSRCPANQDLPLPRGRLRAAVSIPGAVAWRMKVRWNGRRSTMYVVSCRPCGLSYDRHPRCLHRPHGLRPHPHGLLVFWNLHRQQRDQMQPKLEPPIPSRP